MKSCSGSHKLRTFSLITFPHVDTFLSTCLLEPHKTYHTSGRVMGVLRFQASNIYLSTHSGNIHASRYRVTRDDLLDLGKYFLIGLIQVGSQSRHMYLFQRRFALDSGIRFSNFKL